MTGQNDSIGRRWRVGTAAGVLFVPLLLSRTTVEGPRCLFRALFHLPCPGCGLTRSLENLWRGEWALSLRHHPFGPPIFLLCVLVLIGDLRPLPHFPERFAQFWKQRRITVGIAAALLGLWAVRLGLWARGDSFFLW